MAYHPTLGKWIQRDPAGYVDGTDLFQYVQSAPVTNLDPYGTSAADKPPAFELSILRPPVPGAATQARDSSGYSKLWFAQLAVSVPDGIGRYSFQWHVMDDKGNDVTQSPLGGVERRGAGTNRKGQPIDVVYVRDIVREVPGIRRGDETHFFLFNGTDGLTEFFLANIALGGTGQQNVLGGAGATWAALNNLESTAGIASATIEVRCGDKNDKAGPSLDNLKGVAGGQQSYNNLNRNFLGGVGFAEIPTYDDGAEGAMGPADWNNRRVLYEATVIVEWNFGSFKALWTDSEGRGGAVAHNNPAV